VTFTELSNALQEALSLKLPPVAVSLAESAPQDIDVFHGSAAAGCVFWEKGAHQTFATRSADHEMCAIGVYTHNLTPTSETHERELGTVLKVLRDLDYVRPEDLPAIPVLKQKPGVIIYGPLREAKQTPDAVLLFAHSAQGLVITEAVQQVDGGVPPALGRPACAIIPQAVSSGRAALSLGCCGARAYLDVMSDDTALWALPGAKLNVYAERITALARANSLLRCFHQLRKEDVDAGRRPTYSESLARLG
jgi:uncharacterized protein (DUF169 family)